MRMRLSNIVFVLMASVAFSATPVVLLPSTFAFVQVEDSETSSSELPLWALRGENSVEAVRMMSFCDTGVLYATENFGLMPIHKIAGPMTLVIGPGFSPEEKAIIVEVSTEKEWPVPLAVQEGPVDVMPPPDGFIYISRDPNLKSLGAAYPVTKNNLAVAGGVFIGPWSFAAPLIRHELGHLVMGLCHHNLPGIMSTLPYGDGHFSKAELDNVNMASRIASGTCFPGTIQKGLVCASGQASSKSSLDSQSFVLIEG